MPLEAFPYKLAWEASIPTNVNFFIWSLLWKRILTIDNLNARGMTLHNVCVLCGSSEENINHLFLSCSASLLVWKRLTEHIPRMGTIMVWDDPKSFLLNWPKLNNRGLAEAVWCILPYAIFWVLWKVCNETIFENGSFELEKVRKRVICTIWEWLDIIGKSVDVKKGQTLAILMLNWKNLVADSW
ncbi:hypothetical protein FRX31_012191 [Thalictrum thalictroides]|uniref:Reverse transcriptase zinc-binding domain-containing protein n=1 Tax=Thalictrum thalictroides TaxID=46969 RepID=A0A7J6WQ16_THATH|nr:hypothetical protein FRX31_012191 [Thalictrum thalictroides]